MLYLLQQIYVQNKYNSLTDKQLRRFIIETSQTELFTEKLKSKE